MHLELLCIGVSHRSAPVEVRERLALTEDAQRQLLMQLASGDEVMLLSTCNRVELYLATAEPEAARLRVATALAQLAGHELSEHLYQKQGDEALKHLFRVASSLDSMVVGEPQILGQVKDAYELARREGHARGELTRACAAAFACAKQVRSSTAIGCAATSMASAALGLARKVFGGLEGSHVLIVGAGEMSALMARHAAKAGARRMVITNRTPARAEALAAEVGGVAAPFEDMEALLREADVVLSCTASPRPIFTAAAVAAALRHRKGKPLIIVDLSVPRDFEPAVCQLEGVYAYDVDDIERLVAETSAQRAGEAARAEELVARHLASFVEARAARQNVPVIKQMRARAEAIVQRELERTLPRLGELDERQKNAVNAMAMAIVNKVLHLPTVRLRELGGDARGAWLADAAVELFGLDGAEAAPTLGVGDGWRKT